MVAPCSRDRSRMNLITAARVLGDSGIHPGRIGGEGGAGSVSADVDTSTAPGKSTLTVIGAVGAGAVLTAVDVAAESSGADTAAGVASITLCCFGVGCRDG